MTPAGHPTFIRFYLWQGRRWKTLIHALDGAYAGLWLGLLRPRHFEAVDDLHYRSNPSYNGERHNSSGLMDWEALAIDAFFQGAGRLAVIGAGGGRELLALERRGHAVDGFECNPALVAFAEGFLSRHGATGTVRALARDAAPAPAAYEGAIIGWSAYALIVGRTRRIALLHGLRASLPPDAPLLLSFFTEREPATRLKTVYRVARAMRRLLRRPPPEFGDDLIPTFVHRFSRDEIEAELRDAGFRLARYEPQGRGKYDSGWAVALAEPLSADAG
ncbi:hypothetical protein [Sphingomonas sp.]|uniref:hypothetical protein n=1 Tax=Sphingomonas sp. TaxID=28214 RepID=UPI001B12E524|nr:hypothetical protein [Sphingomonas sp.]MBO9714781.1 hypothetical protein [Sphingomonas sp.]